MDFNSSRTWISSKLLMSLLILIAFNSNKLIAGEVVDLKNSIIFGRNDRIPKRVTTDGSKVLVLRSPKSAFPKAGSPFGTYSGGPLDSQLNRAAQDVFYNEHMQGFQPDSYSGPDTVDKRYEYYMKLK